VTIRKRLRAYAVATVAALTLSLATALAPAASAASGGDAASLALDNIGKTAGSCADEPTTNSLGGSEYESSCSGNDGEGEYWCADFAQWVWENSGFDTGGLSAAAGSFYVYGQNNGTLHTSASYVPKPGDAVVYDYAGGGVADHVGIVTSVDSDGNVVTANGDWNGISGSSEGVYARSSSVVSVTIPESERATGDYVDPADMTISGYITPVAGGSSSAPPAGTANPYSPSAVCGSGYGVIDSHGITGATVFLLYNRATGDNCVTTLATNATAAKSMNAKLSVQGGASGSDPGTYTHYAGPVTEHAPNSCVQWGGSYNGSTWTSSWSHCGNGTVTAPRGAGNPYSPTQVCGTGYRIVDSHAVRGATMYLLYNSSSGDACTAAMVDDPSSAAQPMNATLSVQGGASASDPGTFAYYAGPVTEHAPASCVEWGGSYAGSSWTSGWSHC
jgi:hypothetical protein